MNVTCPTKPLKDLLTLTSRGVKKNASVVALECIKVATGDIGIELTATDYELEIRCALGCHVEETGEVILPAKRFMEVIGAFTGPDVRLKVVDGICHLKSGRSHFRLAGYPDPMPTLPPTDETLGIILSQSLFRDMLEKVEFAMGNDVNRPGLNGARLTLANGKVEMAATDTHQLAVYPVQLEGDDLPEFACTLQRRAVTEVQNFLAKDEGEEVEIVVDENQIEFRTPFYTIKSRLNSGRAPNYQQVIPRDPILTVELDRACFLETVKRINVLAKEDAHRFRLEVCEEKASFWTQAVGIGEADEELACNNSDWAVPFTIWLHARQVAGILESFDGALVSLHYTSELRPLIFSPDTGSYYAILMPMVAP
jgi:DNA polymerase-3 subunit beta